MKNPAVSGGDERRRVRGERSSIASVIERGGSLQGLRQSLRMSLLQTHAGYVPRVELTQVAGGAECPEMLDGTIYRPVELGEDLWARGGILAQAQELLEQPGVAQRAAREHHRGGAGLLVGGDGAVHIVQPARQDDRGRQGLDQACGQGVVRNAFVVD